MASLTPKHRSDEITGEAMYEGLVNAGMVMLPSLGGLYAAMQNKSFVKVNKRMRKNDREEDFPGGHHAHSSDPPIAFL